jgi:Domain of unknown function (DUF543)
MTSSSSSSHHQQQYPLYEDLPSDQRVNACIRQGLQDMLVQTSTGLVVGGLAGLVLARRGGGGSYRKFYTAASLGAGVGLGHAWTRTSINLEQMMAPYMTSPTSGTTAAAAATAVPNNAETAATASSASSSSS